MAAILGLAALLVSCSTSATPGGGGSDSTGDASSPGAFSPPSSETEDAPETLGVDQSDQDGYAQMAARLRPGRDGYIIWAVDFARLDDLGFIDRSARTTEGEGIYPPVLDPLLARYPHVVGIPFLWATVAGRSFVWPDTDAVLGFELADAEVAVWTAASSAFQVDARTASVSAVLSEGIEWDGPLSNGDGTWDWRGRMDSSETGDPAVDGLAEVLDQGYQIRVDGPLVMIEELVEEPTPPYEPAVDLLTHVGSAPIAQTFDARGMLQRDDLDEPPGGYLDRVLAAGYTISWPDGEPVHGLHLLMTDPETAVANTERLRATMREDPAVADAFGDQAQIDAVGPVINIILGSGAEDLASRLSNGRARIEGGDPTPVLDAFATGTPLPPFED